MGRFKPGQKVVCIKNGNWINERGQLSKVQHPKYDEIVTVLRYFIDHRYDADYIFTREYDYAFSDEFFEPLVSDAVLEKELESIPEPFTA